MEYLIDGYNLLFALFPSLESLPQNVQVAREKLIQALLSLPYPMRIVFDSPKESGSDHPIRFFEKNLEILFSPKGLCADRYLIEILEQIERKKRVVLVTSDAALARGAKELGFQTLSIEEFLNKVQKKRKKVVEEKPPIAESSYERAVLQEEFEKRLKKMGF